MSTFIELHSDALAVGSLVLAMAGGAVIAYGQSVYDNRRHKKMIADLRIGVLVVVDIDNTYHAGRIASYCRTERICVVRLQNPSEPIKMVPFNNIHFVVPKP